MKVSTLVDYSHFLLVIGNNLNEVSHNVRKESNSPQHDPNRHQPFDVANWEVISIPHGWQRCESKVATDSKLRHIILNFVKAKMFDESVSLRLLVSTVILIENIPLDMLVLWKGLSKSWWKQKPKAPYEIRDDNRNDNKSENFIKVEKHVLGNNFLISWLIVIQELLD